MPSPGMRGWYVELDEELMKEFEQRFPEHGSKARLTTNAVIYAVVNSTLEFGTFDSITLTPGGDDVKRPKRDEGNDNQRIGDNLPKVEGS